MRTSPALQLLSFRRTFAWLILLVVVPSAGLSGFGVLAIINERAAVEKRLGAAWMGRLDTVGQRLRAWIEDAAVAPYEDGLDVSLAGERVSDGRFSIKGGAPAAADPRLLGLLASAPQVVSMAQEKPTAFSLVGPSGSAILFTERRGEEVLGARLSVPALQALLPRLTGDIPGAQDVQFVLRPLHEGGGESRSLVLKLVSGVEAAREHLERPVLAGSELPAPLQDFRLEAVPRGKDPVALASRRNRVVYGVLLGLFYLTLAGGVVYTGRVLYREARLSRLKTDFVSLVSHELRTPLTSIRMFIETLALGRVRDPKETQEVLDLLTKETERLSQMIERVLDWARLESGRASYDREQTTVDGLVDAALSAFRAQRLDAKLELKTEVEPGLPLIQVDKEAMAGALLNLLQNAFKYTGPDKRISVRARKERAGVGIQVEDNGIGIAPKDRKKIFERFYRVDSLLSRTTEGSGLGLSISKRIVEAHGGHISVTSSLGQGSCFTLHLPAQMGAGP
jgi:signal transduction histidine kinase